jgi:hypothetical protein
MTVSHKMAIAGATLRPKYEQGSADLLSSALAGFTPLGRAEVNHSAGVIPRFVDNATH